MKVKIICSGNTPGFDFKKHQAFIYDQTEAIKSINNAVDFSFFFINGKGWKGYLRELKRLKKEIENSPCDIIHAHFGLACFFATLQSKVPVVSTFHGSDINNKIIKWFSAIASLRSHASIFVSNKLKNKAVIKKNPHVIPCGVDTNLFRPLDKTECRRMLNLDPSKKYILFSSAFSNPVKNFELLKSAINIWGPNPPEVLELWNKAREEVPLWMNAADLCVLTSFSEGSPQFIKEALACNRPLLATDVGDISEVFHEVNNAIIVNFDAENVRAAIQKLLSVTQSDGRGKMSHFDHLETARKILAVYKKVCTK
ncbi:MAG: hypothetical protein RLZZ46_347 [Bacteroidota bacterium]